MELVAGIIIGIIFFIAGLKIKKKMDQLEDKIYELSIQLLEKNRDLSGRLKMLEERFKFEKKSNGLNFQEIFKDVIKLKEHLTYIQNK